ncbi:uncharacterized protein zgc:193726 isoform X1 [Puntigrus tetrazona]|uniref:uncharacterized protein zgc:193726 isoform X1 n=1 Tax=Puntigrus tetrazona TaxID=1606681 RepID=UPI001C8AF403|nr:uncharacterized protein zgc:193726 isoform X1 [Puntigrus tetrazona]
MILVWTLTSLVLSCTLGFPVLNNTSNSYTKAFPNVTERNITVDVQKTNQTSYQLPMYFAPELIPPEVLTDLPNLQMAAAPGCSLATCAIQTLAHRMQIGNEKAGDSASDAWGLGKK